MIDKTIDTDLSQQEIIKKYTYYNTAYAKIISGFESPLRGIMHYTKGKHGTYINTTLFSAHEPITLGVIVKKQKTCEQKISELQQLMYDLREDAMFYIGGMSKFLERNIEKTISMMSVLKDATIWIEAQKGGYKLSPQHAQTCHTMTMNYYHLVLGNAISSQPKQLKLVYRYVASVYEIWQKNNPDKHLVHIAAWLEKFGGGMGYVAKPYHNADYHELVLTSSQTVAILIFCLSTLFTIRKQDKKIYIHIEKDSHPELEKALGVFHKQKLISLIHTKQEIGQNDFCISIGTYNWRISKNTLFAPIMGLEIPLKKLCQLIDHEIGTHEATTLADTKLLKRKSHGYSKMEEGMAVFNQRMVDCVSIKDLKRTPTYHHVACLFAEQLHFSDLKETLYDFFIVIGDDKKIARKHAKQTALRAKRYLSLDMLGANSHLLAYTNGYLYFLDMYKKSMQIDDNSFRLLWQWMHLGKFSSQDLKDIKPFLKIVKPLVQELPKPIYFGRFLYQSLVGTLTFEEIFMQDKRYHWTGMLDEEEKKQVLSLLDKVKGYLGV